MIDGIFFQIKNLKLNGVFINFNYRLTKYPKYSIFRLPLCKPMTL